LSRLPFFTRLVFLVRYAKITVAGQTIPNPATSPKEGKMKFVIFCMIVEIVGLALRAMAYDFGSEGFSTNGALANHVACNLILAPAGLWAGAMWWMIRRDWR
jgi:hypothetical protein